MPPVAADGATFTIWGRVGGGVMGDSPEGSQRRYGQHMAEGGHGITVHEDGAQRWQCMHTSKGAGR